MHARFQPSAAMLGVVLLAIALPGAALADVRDPYTHFFHQTLGDFGEELEVAREEGKKGILIFFEMDECPFCHRMKDTVLNRPDIQDWYRENFLCFSVDVEGDTEITDFQGDVMAAKDFAFKVNRVRATPVFAFYDLEGNRIVRYTGATRDAREFLWLGEYAAEGHYTQTKFTRYKREKRKALKSGQTP